MMQYLARLTHLDWTSWLSRGPWNTLFAGLFAAIVTSLITFLAAVVVLRRTLRADRTASERRHQGEVAAIERYTTALLESQRRERTIAAAAQLTSGWTAPGWEWVALGPNGRPGLSNRRRWELVRRWLADGSRLYMNLVDDELPIYHAITKTNSVLAELLEASGGGPEPYITTARTFSNAINGWVRGDRTVEQTATTILNEVARVDQMVAPASSAQ
jgi:hypothetical protein